MDFLSYVIYIIALSRRFSIFGYMISQAVGCFLINRLKEDIAARLDLIKNPILVYLDDALEAKML